MYLYITIQYRYLSHLIKFTDALFYRAEFSEGVLGDLFRNEFGELPFFWIDQMIENIGSKIWMDQMITNIGSVFITGNKVKKFFLRIFISIAFYYNLS